MAFDMSRFGTSRWVTSHPDNVYTHGSTEPVLTVLDVRGIRLHDLFLIGLNDRCGSLLVPTEDRAHEIARALEPGYETRVGLMRHSKGDTVWATRYTQRALDGTTGSPFLTGLTLADGREVIKDGRWVN